MTDYEELKKYLATPRDLTKESFETKAALLTLHFIGYIVKPVGIEESLYQRCLQAFNNNRGKCEWEETAVLNALKDSAIGENDVKGLGEDLNKNSQKD